MQESLYPPDWKSRARACLERAHYRCEVCRISHGTLRISKREHNLYFVHLHAAHVNHDPHNPQAELRALCPSCHLKHDRQAERLLARATTSHRRGYQVVGVAHLIATVRSAGLFIIPEDDHYRWQLGDMMGVVADPLEAIGSALHWLMMERHR